MTYSIAANAADNRVLTFLLAKVDFPSGAVYWTNADIPIKTTGAQGTAPAAHWLVRSFKADGLTSRQGEIAGGSVAFANGDNLLTAYVFGSPNIHGIGLHIWEAWFDPARADARTMTAIPDDTQQVYEGRVDFPDIARSLATASAIFNLAPTIDPLSKTLPRRSVVPTCMFDFKGVGCQADGTDTSCDRTLDIANVANGCAQPGKKSGAPAGGNKLNFGGFIMATAIQP